MKTLKKIQLHDPRVLTNPEMKHVTGGFSIPNSANCYANCGGQNVMVISGCFGTCMYESSEYVICSGGGGPLGDYIKYGNC